MKKLVAGLLLLLACAPASARPMTGSDIKDLLDRAAALRGPGGLTVDYREVRKVAMLKEPVIEEGRLSFSPPNQFRKEAMNPRRVVHVSDGITLWVVFPDDNRAEKYPLKANRSLAASFEALASALRLSDLDKQFEMSGERLPDGYQLRLIPRQRALQANVSSIGITLDAALALQKISVQAPNGNHSTLTLTNEKSGRLSDDVFQYTPPKGVEVSAPLG
ncbi:MAG: outer membrane lipoprotein carrier protein LolA [Terrimicrobiaceae bacterium]